MKTAFTATRLAIAGFIVPFCFALNPALLMVDVHVLELIQIVITSVLGILGVSAGLSGYLLRPMHWVIRALCVVAGVCLIYASVVTDVIGIVVLAAVFVLQLLENRRATA